MMRDGEMSLNVCTARRKNALMVQLIARCRDAKIVSTGQK